MSTPVLQTWAGFNPGHLYPKVIKVDENNCTTNVSIIYKVVRKGHSRDREILDPARNIDLITSHPNSFSEKAFSCPGTRLIIP